MVTTWQGQVAPQRLVFLIQPECPHHPSSLAWVLVGPRCITTTNTREDLKEEVMMLAVCLTRCDVYRLYDGNTFVCRMFFE